MSSEEGASVCLLMSAFIIIVAISNQTAVPHLGGGRSNIGVDLVGDGGGCISAEGAWAIGVKSGLVVGIVMCLGIGVIGVGWARVSGRNSFRVTSLDFSPSVKTGSSI